MSDMEWEYGVEIWTHIGVMYVPYHSKEIARVSMKDYEDKDKPRLVRRLVSKWEGIEDG